MARAHFVLAELYQAQGDDERSETHNLLRAKCREKRAVQAGTLTVRRQLAAERRRARKQKQTHLPHRDAVSAAAGAHAPSQSSHEFVIVSGLPRSGTSLMMQMLCAGGLEPMTDGAREADEHNQMGYFEWEEIRRLRDDPRLIEQVGDRAVKVVSALVTSLPACHRYKIIFMRRSISEILASQHRMRYGQMPTATDDRMAAILRKHEEQTLSALRVPNVDLLEFDYGDLVQDLSRHQDLLEQFLGPQTLPHIDRIADTVRPELHRARTPQ